jgi:hypothetical protein
MKNRPLVSRPRLPAVSVHIKWLVGVVVVALLLGGTATAAKKITGKDVADSSLTGKDLRDSSVTGADVRDRSLSPRDFSESIRGPAGPAGPPGATGQTGPNGFTVLTEQDGAPTTIPPGAQRVTTPCGPNELAVSGGYTPTNANATLTIAASMAALDPATGRDGWSVIVVNADAVNGSLLVIAYCAPLPAAAASASARSRSAQGAQTVLSAHRVAWQRLRRVETAMRTKLASRR